MKIETINYMKKNGSKLDVSEPLMITQNGEPAYVVESYEDHKRRDEAVALLKLLSISENSAQNESVLSTDDIKAKLAKRREVLLQSK